MPSVLRTRLVEAGYSVIDDEVAHAKDGFASLTVLDRIIVKDESGSIVAMGASSDPADALAHAMLGWFRENPLPGSDIPAGVGTLPS